MSILKYPQDIHISQPGNLHILELYVVILNFIFIAFDIIVSYNEFCGVDIHKKLDYYLESVKKIIILFQNMLAFLPSHIDSHVKFFFNLKVLFIYF